MGESGVGKSTLMGTLVGLYPISSGKIYIDNINIDKFSLNSLRENIILLKQTPEFLPGFYKTLNTNQLEILTNLINLFGLSEEVNIFEIIYNNDLEAIDNLSGGQKQRLYLCMAITLAPSLIILDETLSGLNEKWINVYFDYVTKNNLKTIIITHDQNIMRKSDEVIKIRNFKKNRLV